MGANSIDIAASHRTAIGCSQIAQALGLSTWGSPLELFNQLTGRESIPDIGGELRVALGEPMEEVLKPHIEARLGFKLRRDRKEYRHPILPLVGHVDFRGAVRPGRPVVDVKTSLGYGARHRFGADGTDELDTSVILQMHGYLQLTGAEVAYVAALVPGPELKIYTIRADKEMTTLIEDGLAEFWHCVLTDTPPQPRSEADARSLWARHSEGLVIDADRDLHEMLLTLADVKAEAKALAKQEQELKDALFPRLADAETVQWGGQTIATYKANKDSVKVDWEKMANENVPNMHRIIDAYKTTQPGARVLRLSKNLTGE